MSECRWLNIEPLERRGRPRKAPVQPSLAEALMPALRELLDAAHAVGYNRAIGKARDSYLEDENKAVTEFLRAVQRVINENNPNN